MNITLIRSLFLAFAVSASYQEPEDDKIGKLQPYQLPAAAASTLEKVAAQTDVLVFGEMHGTQEVPAVAMAMLKPLDKLGYGVLALEVPFDQRDQLVAWATGKTTEVPRFFATPGADGRGNIQTLSLIRAAISEPLRWKLVCFDDTDDLSPQDIEELKKRFGPEGVAPAEIPANQPLPDAEVSFNIKADAKMASNLARECRPLDPHGKVLAICGNVHARTMNHSAPDDPFHSLWPSFAAGLQRTHTAWRIPSVDIRPHGGAGFFNGEVSALGGPPLGEAQTRTTPRSDWDLELHLPRATPATFLAPPSDTPLIQPVRDK